ncbi:TetR/AcrR family transcriptional regulator [Acidaminococcus fermentans]|uniref:Transcriptional regulator, TetR family n=1 Tax=Acidaminococcus fermentans TaxID=905 RepID=A0A1H2U4W8_ACIFE|nr:TetR/AcrR family transcriptional regulator [Acidaminococcus fermentans]SDW50649.1 transcriptional regulator, TetR family [Acidaminococcus fermentans]
MPKVSEEFLLARREEILDACAKLYENMSFKDITLKEIGKITSFNRTAIYNYFNSKEEIFLALMQREYECWSAEVDGLVQDHEQMTRDEIAQALSHLLEKHERLLKLLSMNHFDLEENSRYENLVEFKKAYGESIRAVARCLDKFCPEMSEQDKAEVLYVYFPFMFGIYPYAVVTEKQGKAMEDAGVGFVSHSIYELSYTCLKKLLV